MADRFYENRWVCKCTAADLLSCVLDDRVILGGGVVKHHTCNANLMRNGAEFSVYINTGQVFPVLCVCQADTC